MILERTVNHSTASINKSIEAYSVRATRTECTQIPRKHLYPGKEVYVTTEKKKYFLQVNVIDSQYVPDVSHWAPCAEQTTNVIQYAGSYVIDLTVSNRIILDVTATGNITFTGTTPRNDESIVLLRNDTLDTHTVYLPVEISNLNGATIFMPPLSRAQIKVSTWGGEYVTELHQSILTQYVMDSLVMHYDGVDNTGSGHDSDALVWKDLAGNNDGVLTNCVWMHRSLKFVGASLVEFVGNIPQSYTMQISYRAYPSQGAYPRLWGDSPFPSLYLHSAQGYRFGLIGQGVDLAFIPATTPARDSSLVTAAISYEHDSGIVYLYVRGTRVASVSTANVVNPQSVPLVTLGGRLSPPDRYFNGEIHNFMMYDRVLTEDEIMTNYLVDTQKYKL